MKVKHTDLYVSGHAAHRARTRIDSCPKKCTNFLYRRLRSEDTVYLRGADKGNTSQYYDKKYAVIYVCSVKSRQVELITVLYPQDDPRYPPKITKHKLYRMKKAPSFQGA